MQPGQYFYLQKCFLLRTAEHNAIVFGLGAIVVANVNWEALTGDMGNTASHYSGSQHRRRVLTILIY